MSRLSFGMTADEQKQIEFEARVKGITPSAYAKMAVMTHIGKHASTGAVARRYRAEDQKAERMASTPSNVESPANSEEG